MEPEDFDPADHEARTARERMRHAQFLRHEPNVDRLEFTTDYVWADSAKPAPCGFLIVWLGQDGLGSPLWYN